MKVRGTVFTVECDVFDYHRNLLGIELLYRFNCVLDFNDLSLTFRHFSYYQPRYNNRIYITLDIDGQETEALVDTGAECYIVGPLELAKKCGMPLEDVSHMKRRLHCLTYGIGQYKYRCDVMKLKFLDAEESDVPFWVQPEGLGDFTVLGLGMMNWIRFEFHDDGTWEMTRHEPEWECESNDGKTWRSLTKRIPRFF